jgi:hypothetical protein
MTGRHGARHTIGCWTKNARMEVWEVLLVGFSPYTLFVTDSFFTGGETDQLNQPNLHMGHSPAASLPQFSSAPNQNQVFVGCRQFIAGCSGAGMAGFPVLWR